MFDSIALRFVLGTVLLAGLVSCGPEPDANSVEPTSMSTIVTAASSDPAVQRAIDESTQLVRSASKDPQAWHRHGRVLQANGFAVEAVTAYGRSLELQPKNRAAVYLRAMAQRQIGESEAATGALRTLSDAGQADAAMELRVATWSLEDGDLETAEAAARKAVERAPRHHGAIAMLGRVLIESGRATEAVEVLRPVVEGGLRHRYMDFLYASALVAAGRDDEARNWMPDPAPSPPDWDDPYLESLRESVAGLGAAVTEARDLLKGGRVAEALVAAERIHRDHPESVEAANLVGLCLRDAGRHDEALDVYYAALDRWPRHPELLYQTAAVLVSAAEHSRNGSQLPTALSFAEAAIEVDPGRYESFGIVGAVYLWMGRLEPALAAFERCATLDPLGPAQCPTKVGNVMIYLGRVDEGLEVLSRAVEQQPLEPAPNVTYAIQLRDAGRTAELEELLDRLRAGGSTFAPLLAQVEAAVETAPPLRPPSVSK